MSKGVVAAVLCGAGAACAGGLPPYAFDYADMAADLGSWTVVTTETTAVGKRLVREWTSPDKRMVLRSTETEYAGFPVVEYVPELIARGDVPTDIVSSFQSFSFSRRADSVGLRGNRGTVDSDLDFEPLTVRFGSCDGATNRYEMVATEGRSSAQFLPWVHFDFQDGDGMVVALGWSGAWRGDYSLEANVFTAKLGMVETHFRMMPGERLRLPSVLVFSRKRDVSPMAMMTVIHRFMVDVKSPRDSKGELIRPITAITAGGGNKTPEMMKKIISWKVRNDMPFDCFWVDAGWNGPAHMPDLVSNCGNMWSKFVGDWRFNPSVHPDGDLGDIADAAHAAGMRMLLWMEPERCVAEPPPPIYREHRDWLLPRSDAALKTTSDKRRLCVDFGNPEALGWAVETASEHIRRCKLDIFRQDFNMNTLPIWQGNDAPDRKGITEIKHINGLWKFWDTLRERFPHLVIENCASGGRRIDYEAVSRGHSYCRTDFALGHRGASQITDCQNVLVNTLPYLPFQGGESTAAHVFDDYGIFSAFASGNVFTPSDWNQGVIVNAFAPEECAWFRKVFTVGKRMSTFYEGDYYPLVDNFAPLPSPAWKWRRNITWSGEAEKFERIWCAWQLHRADLGAGFAIAFRRLDCRDHRFSARLGGIETAATYEVETYGDKVTVMSGADLENWRVELLAPRSFRLVFYRKIKQPKEGSRCP